MNAIGQALYFVRDKTQRGLLCLGSIKACYGHTEGAAGVTGALLGMVAEREQCQAAIVNLRGINPYVEAAALDWSKHRIAACMPRQSGAISSWQPQQMAATSSFGMSGTNAQALMCVPYVHNTAEKRSAFWQRAR
jgi:acyl transferase domain-containing protein